jgi:hypothetical protein
MEHSLGFVSPYVDEKTGTGSVYAIALFKAIARCKTEAVPQMRIHPTVFLVMTTVGRPLISHCSSSSAFLETFLSSLTRLIQSMNHHCLATGLQGHDFVECHYEHE